MNKRKRSVLKYVGYTGLVLTLGFPFYFIALFLIGLMGLGA